MTLNSKKHIQLSKLFEKWSGESQQCIEELPVSGSKREYYRIYGKTFTAIGVYNPNQRENEVFIRMAYFLKKERISVPSVYAKDLKKNIYIIEDMGDQSLFSVIRNLTDQPGQKEELKNLLQSVLAELCRIQIVAGRDMDFSLCYPISSFGKELILKDLEYFRDNFLSKTRVNFDLYKLNRDFGRLADYVNQADSRFFMYRDFQSRNILIHNGEFCFLDFQGGMKGPLQYDVVSFLFQARARLPQDLREELVEYYFSISRMLTPISEFSFFRYYYAIALIRVLQTLGAYGLRGLKEGKDHFIQSIPFALDNLDILRQKNDILRKMPELSNVLELLNQLNQRQNGINEIFDRNDQ